MSDTSTNKFTAMGTTAERTAFVPDPGTPTPTPAQGYTFFDTDDSTLYAWDGSAWQPAAPGTGDVTASGTLTAGLVVVGDGGTAVDVLAAGSDGNVLTQAGGVATWASPTTGSLILLEQHTASSSATLDFTAFASSTYDTYSIQFVNVLPATDGVTFYMRAGTGAGPTWDTGSNYSSRLWQFSGASSAETNTGAAQMFLSRASTVGNDSRWGIVGNLSIFNLSSASVRKMGLGHVFYEQNATGGLQQDLPTVVYDSLTAVTGLRFYFSSGNIASGTIRVYGLAK